MTAQQEHKNKIGSNDTDANINATATTNEPKKIISAAIDEALQHDVGPEAKKLIMQYIEQKYGMDFNLIEQYREEFENYLREVLHESAEIIIARIRSIIEDSKRSSMTTTSRVNRKATTVKRLSNTVHFLFCDHCFWSASSLSGTFELKCMSCGSELKCALPISQTEVFTYELDHKRGLSMYFS